MNKLNCFIAILLTLVVITSCNDITTSDSQSASEETYVIPPQLSAIVDNTNEPEPTAQYAEPDGVCSFGENLEIECFMDSVQEKLNTVDACWRYETGESKISVYEDAGMNVDEYMYYVENIHSFSTHGGTLIILHEFKDEEWLNDGYTTMVNEQLNRLDYNVDSNVQFIDHSNEGYSFIKVGDDELYALYMFDNCILFINCHDIIATYSSEYESVIDICEEYNLQFP